MPLGFVGIDSTASLTNDEEANSVSRKRERASDTKVADSVDQLKREEWILEPGESQALNGMIRYRLFLKQSCFFFYYIYYI